MIPHSFAGVTGVLADFAPALANHLWQSTVFAVLAGVLTLALRRNHARTRYWIWMAASVKFLVPFALLIAIGSHLAKPHRAAVTQAGMYFALEDVSEPFAQQAAPAVSPVAAPVAKVDWAAVLPASCGVVWLGGFVAVLCLWYVRWRRIAAEMREADPVEEGRELEALLRLEHASGIGARIRLLQSPSAMEPGVFGIARPVLAWPVRISERLDDTHLAAVLAHEVCHVRRRDNLTASIHMVVEAVFWFYPLVWWLGARLVEERERACDEEVLELCKQPEVYAESILKVCEFCVESPLACVSGVTGADLKQRIVEIMTERVVRKLGPGRKLLLVAVGLAVVAAPILLGQVKAAQALSEMALLQPKPVLRPPPPPTKAVATSAPIEISQASAAPVSASSSSISIAQKPQQAKSLQFEAATIKPGKPPSDPRLGESRTSNGGPGGLFQMLNTPLKQWVEMGLSVQDDALKAPSWLDTTRFDLDARVPAGESASPEMMKALLIERFGLKWHEQTQVVSGYELVADKKVLLKPASLMERLEGVHGSGYGPALMNGTNMSMSEVAVLLEKILGKPVVDATHLSGGYDINLMWHPVDDPASTEAHRQYWKEKGIDVDSLPSTVFAAVQEQLGLRLQSAKVPSKIIVVDQINRQPTEN